MKTRFSNEFYNEESREIIVSRDTKRTWAVCLDLLIEFDRVCRLHQIQYFLDSGTLLGAARHKGFIPWDDDVDVIMFRGEYVKLCSVAAAEFRTPYFFQNNNTDPGSMRGHAQLRNSETTAILKFEMSGGKPLFKFNQGVFIDIFILDDIPDDDKEYEAFADRLAKLKEKPYAMRHRMQCAKALLGGSFSLHNIRFGFWGLVDMMVDGLLGRDGMRIAFERFERFAQMYNGKDCRRCANITLEPRRPLRKRFDRTLFGSVDYLVFEGRRFPVPQGWRSVLAGYFGDCRKHVIGGQMHGGLFIDLDNPYTEYLKK